MKLHYIYDPLCGWCYGASPLLAAAATLSAMRIAMHAGGMMAGKSRQQVSPQLRAYVMPHDQRIAQVTGQPFGEAYFNKLLTDPTAVFDSEPPITAILASQTLQANIGLQMLQSLQKAHYVQGQKINDIDVLANLATSIGMNKQSFLAAYEAQKGAMVAAHIAQSRQLLREVGGQGFPTFVLEHDQKRQVVNFGDFLGQPQAFVDFLKNQLPVVANDSSAPFCGIDGC